MFVKRKVYLQVPLLLEGSRFLQIRIFTICIYTSHGVNSNISGAVNLGMFQKFSLFCKYFFFQKFKK